MKRVTKWAGNSITALLVMLLLTVSYYSLSARINGGTPKVFGYELLTVVSGSMEPVIHTGSVIAVQPSVDPLKLKVGDIITFRSPENKDTIITHRIEKIQGTGMNTQYVTKGDANDSEDPKPVSVGSIIGQYGNITIPFLGYMLAFAKSKMGVITLLIVPGAILILWQMISLFVTISKLEKEKTDQNNPIASEDPSHIV